MISDDQVLIEYKDGFSFKDNNNTDAERSDFELRRSSLFMTSCSIEALTHSRIATPKGALQRLEKGGYDYFHSLFEKSFETFRTIKAEIDIDSLPAKIYCVSREEGQLKAKLANKIKIEIREVVESERQEIYCGNFLFHEVNTQSNEGDLSVCRVLTFYNPLTSETFSKIFDAVKAGDNFLGLSLLLPACVSWRDETTGNVAATHLLDPEEANVNVTMLTGVFSRKAKSTGTDSAHLADLNEGAAKGDDVITGSLAEVCDLLYDASHYLNESRGFLRTLSMCMVIIVPFVVIAVLKLLL